MEAAIHLGPNYIDNLEVYRKTNFEELADIDIGPSSWNSECDTDWLDSSVMDEIYTNSRPGDYVDESKSTRLFRFRLLLEENVIQKRIKDGKNQVEDIRQSNFYREIIWSWWWTNWIRAEYFPGLTSWRSSRRSRKTCKIETLNLKSLKIESSSCQCSMTSNGQREEIQKSALQIPKKWKITRRSSREDTGQSSAQETKRSGTELSVTHLKEIGVHRLTDGGKIQRNPSPSIQEHQCFESWNSEKKEKQTYHTLRCGCFDTRRCRCFENRTHSSHDSLSKSAQYLRSSIKLVWRVRSKAEWERVDFGKVRGKRKWPATEECESGRSKFFGANSKEW